MHQVILNVFIFNVILFYKIIRLTLETRHYCKERLLMNAVDDHDARRVDILIKHGANVNHICRFGLTPLYLAIMNADLNCVNVLLDNNVNVNQMCGNGLWTPLIAAVHYNYDKIVESLLKAKTIINGKDGILGTNALMTAAKRGHYECLNILLEYGSSLNDQNDDGKTALMMAAQKGHVRCVQLLIHHSASINIQDDEGETALMKAARKGRTECLQFLIDHSANINIQDEYGNTALIHAAANAHRNCIHILINANANLEITDYRKNNALMKALMTEISGINPCAVNLIIAGCPVNQVNSSGNTPMSLAVRDSNFYVTELLIERGANVNECLHNRTALWHVAHKGKEFLVQRLIDANADPNVGDPPLVQAARYCSTNSVKILLQAGADVNAIDPRFGTALLVAGCIGSFPIASMVLRADADVNTCNTTFSRPILYNENALMLLFAAGEDCPYFNSTLGVPPAIIETRRDFSLQNICRKAIRKHLVITNPKINLFRLVKLLPLPELIKKFLVYDISL